MIAFADTSIVCALLRIEQNSPAAWKLSHELENPLRISSLVAFEFRQSARLQSFRFSSDRTQGWSSVETGRLLAQFNANIEAGAFVLAEVDWPAVHTLAEHYSQIHTLRKGHRTLDVLHVATAVHLHADLFCTMDRLQAELARATGLEVRP